MEQRFFLQNVPENGINPFLTHSILYFLETNENRVIVDILSTCEQSNRQDVMKSVIDIISKVDSRKQLEEHKKQLISLRTFLKDYYPELYAEIMFECCVAHILYNGFIDYSEFFQWKDFDDISENVNDPWVKDLFLYITENVELDTSGLDLIFTNAICYNLLLALNKDFKAGESSSENMFNWFKVRVDKFAYLARTINYFMSIEHNKSILFALPGDADYQLLELYIDGKAFRRDAVEAIQEFSLFFSEILPKEFVMAIVNDTAFTSAWNEYNKRFHDGGDETLIAKLYQKQWFRKYHGITELVFKD